MDDWGEFSLSSSIRQKKMCLITICDQLCAIQHFTEYFSYWVINKRRNMHAKEKYDFYYQGLHQNLTPTMIYIYCWLSCFETCASLFFFNSCLFSIGVHRKTGRRATRRSGKESPDSHQCQQMGRRRWRRCQSKFTNRDYVCVFDVHALNFYFV